MSTFLKELPNYDDELITDEEIERAEAKVRSSLLGLRVEAVVANVQFDPAAAAANRNVREDGLYVGTHRCVGRYVIRSKDLAIELWANAIPDDEEDAGTDWLFWNFRDPASGTVQMGPIAYCPFCGMHLESLINSDFGN